MDTGLCGVVDLDASRRAPDEFGETTGSYRYERT